MAATPKTRTARTVTRATQTKTGTKSPPKSRANHPTTSAVRARATKASSTRAKAAKTGSTRASATKAATTRAKTTGSSTSAKLATYRSKRDFGRTPEPQGKSPSRWKTRGNPFFVIQKHAASRLHYDFRLEVDGVLKSWAVPKGPSMNPGDKRLAVETEDHPMDYADFEGIIPEGEYGGGTVIVWDAGPYRNLKQRAGEQVPMAESYERGQIEIWLEGKKIRGGFALIHSRMGDSEKNWLLIKMKDTAADPASDPVATRTESVMSGRTIEEVRKKPKKVWSSAR